MKKQTDTKLKKKHLKSSLIKNIEETLGSLKNEKAIKQVRKTVKDAVNQITKKFFNKLKKRNFEKENNNKPPVKSPATYRKSIRTKKAVGKPSVEDIKKV